jgi:hypothetical protein
MRMANYLRKLILPGLATFGAIASAGAPAQTATLAGSGITFGTQCVAASTGGGSVTIGVGGGILGVPVKYTSNTFTAAAPASYTITFTLPSGVNFANNPSATGDGTNFAATLSQVSGGVGNNFISFTGTANAVAAVTGTVTLGSFNVTGATALATTNTTNFQMTASVSSTIAALNDTGSKGQLAASASVVQFTTFPSASLPLVIDITPGNLGAKFLQNATNSTVGDQGDAVIVVFFSRQRGRHRDLYPAKHCEFGPGRQLGRHQLAIPVGWCGRAGDQLPRDRASGSRNRHRDR